ncbi:uncharacterized protein MKK02DRAFT_43947 [Dioszegia hungarica]|uniref:Uncharacterized protein n=1 Tax=Dioszegia hungarica TaxID=4972 RepID=A0AA38LVG9_9TREE|nr:uncharacterized protein MKK02DRAFT_43947 [Dioszegia hungarica]KAI9635266.1 hypothetical protein MKK02DRAFT_43947 [Dioszegia hungarica]
MYAPKGGGGGNGVDGPLNPFVITPPPADQKEDEIPGYVKRFGAYHTFLPAGTLLPQGCSFAMQATVDFGLHFPTGTKVPGGFLLPVSVVKKEDPPPTVHPEENPVCCIQ